MNTGGVIIHTNQVSQNLNGGRNILREGSQVLVRIISDKGGGKYEGAVAGVRVSLQSSRKLEPGKTFLASISAKDGTIYISPKENIPAQEKVQINLIQNEQIADMLKQLGLPADEVSLHLFQQLKQMGLKLDVSLLQKLHNIAIKFKGKEKAASEILMILKEKGIAATEEEILQLLFELEGQFSSDNSDETGEQKQFELLNKINSKEGKWYLLPFEITQKTDDAVIGNGNLKLLYLHDNLSLMNVDCNYNGKNHLFSVKFQNKKCTSVNFNIEGLEKQSAILIQSLKTKLLSQSLDGVKVEWVERDLIEGTACGTEQIISVGGMV